GTASGTDPIDPEKVDETAPFDNPEVFENGENEYEVDMTIEIFSFNPDEIEILVESTVHFTMTLKNVLHEFQVVVTNINAMVTHGQNQKAKQTINKPGEYLVLCNEYCGAGHDMMSTTITVK